MRLIQEFLRHILPGVVRPIHVLWNEVIGFIFFCLALFVAASTWRRAQHFTGDPGGLLILAASGFFAVLLLWFAVSSFWKARKISRSAPPSRPAPVSHSRRS